MFSPNKELWENRVKESLGKEFIMVSSYALGATHLIVMLHINLMPLLSNVMSDCIATGISNVLGNKGAVGIGFKIGESSFLAMSCHFAAH